jgi:hypothetical protein
MEQEPPKLIHTNMDHSHRWFYYAMRGLFIAVLYLVFTKKKDMYIQNILKIVILYILLSVMADAVYLPHDIITLSFITKIVAQFLDDRLTD